MQVDAVPRDAGLYVMLPHTKEARASRSPQHAGTSCPSSLISLEKNEIVHTNLDLPHLSVKRRAACCFAVGDAGMPGTSPCFLRASTRAMRAANTPGI